MPIQGPRVQSHPEFYKYYQLARQGQAICTVSTGFLSGEWLEMHAVRAAGMYWCLEEESWRQRFRFATTLKANFQPWGFM